MGVAAAFMLKVHKEVVVFNCYHMRPFRKLFFQDVFKSQPRLKGAMASLTSQMLQELPTHSGFILLIELQYQVFKCTGLGSYLGPNIHTCKKQLNKQDIYLSDTCTYTSASTPTHTHTYTHRYTYTKTYFKGCP